MSFLHLVVKPAKGILFNGIFLKKVAGKTEGKVSLYRKGIRVRLCYFKQY